MNLKAVLNWSGVCYIVMLIASVFILVLSIFQHNSDGLVISIPVFILSLIMVFRDNKTFKLSPDLCFLLILMMIIAHISDAVVDDRSHLAIIPNLAFGILLALLGVASVKSMLRNAPEINRGRPFVIAFTAFCISTTLCEILKMLSLGLDVAWNGQFQVDLPVFVIGAAFSVFGCFVSCLLYYLNENTGILGGRFSKLTAVVDTAADEESRRNSIRELISQGESSTLEFKSTIRINLATGEKDPRMEKAVLKTIVAFLNTRGGTLLIGVSDSGEIIGTDESSFESRDRMLLHLNHLIEDKIGREFLVFINYYIVDFDGKSVIRVDCRMSDSPTFLLDGKEQVFYVRSGPSSIDLHGMDLLRYANHNFGRVIKRAALNTGEKRE